MATWVAAIVDTNGRPDFWAIARRHHVTAAIDTVPVRASIDCEAGDFEASTRLAQALSAELGTVAIGLFMQTAVDAYGLRVFDAGQLVRCLEYTRDDGGWLTVSGTAQPWEPVLLFDGPAELADGGHWPDTLDDDLDDADVARYEAARARGDARDVMDLVHATQHGLLRVARSLGVEPGRPDAQHRRPRWWQRLLGDRRP